MNKNVANCMKRFEAVLIGLLSASLAACGPTATPTSIPSTATLTMTVSPTTPPTPVRVTESSTATATLSPVIGTVSQVLRVRGGPGIDYAILGKLAIGTPLTLLARSADGKWFQIAYPTGSNQRGWVAGEFLQVQGSSAQLLIAQAPTPPPTRPATAIPTATPTAPVTDTAQPGDACAPIPNQSYGTLLLMSGPTDRPAESHPDLNLGLRGYAPTNAPKALIDLQGTPDPGAPQLRGLFGNKRIPGITRGYQVFAWDWNANARGPLIDDPEVTLLGLQTTPGEAIYTPRAGGDLGEGYAALVLYASQDRITLKYTREDHVANGYTLHIEKVCVEPTLLALYRQLNNPKRHVLPALRVGQPFGRAMGSEIGIVMRDKGSFMDPRSRQDWWTGQ